MAYLAKFFRNGRIDIGVIGVLTGYLAVYALLITKGHGIPYVMDNNETFSALNHAYNLWNFDFFRSFGLADDTVSPFAAAHPIVHTHQGDFPRLFSFLLFSLGARSAEAQIWITTFTIGLASILMAYCFFKRQAGTIFAICATFLLMTDYLLFAQWQVNTYRVWHGFFLFAGLLCAYGLSEWKRSHWVFATIILYAALLYWELTFASFVAIAVGAYTIWIYRRSPRLIVTAGVTQTIGAALGLGILIVQLVLYLGWQDFITDIKLTYTARNLMEDRVGTAAAAIHEFYSTKDVSFFFNFQSGESFNGVTAFVRSFFANILQVPTLLFALIALGLAVATLIADSRFLNAPGTDVSDPRATFAAPIILITSIFLFILLLLLDKDMNLSFSETATAIKVVVFFSISAIAVVFSTGLRRLAAIISGTLPGFRRCTIASLYLFAFGLLAFLQGDQGLWVGLVMPITGWIAKLFFGASALFGSFLLLTGSRSALGRWQNVPMSLVPFFISGLLGYLFVYKFSAGYLHTGYLYRLCPLIVFHIDALLALGLFSTFAISKNLFCRIEDMTSRLVKTSVAILSGSLCSLLVAYWGFVQLRYTSILPPNRFSFAESLKSLTLPNEGIVSNQYAVPFAYIAKTWGYMAPEFENIKRDKPLEPYTNKDYLWFADRQSNQDYRRPGIFVCFEPTSLFPGLIVPASSDAANVAVRDFLRTPRCSEMAIASELRQLEQKRAECLDAHWFMTVNDARRKCAAWPIESNEELSPSVEASPHIKLLMYDEKQSLWALYRIQWGRSTDNAVR